MLQPKPVPQAADPEKERRRREYEYLQLKAKAAAAQPSQPAPQAAPRAQAPASRAPLGGATGEFDLSKFEALPKVQQAAPLAPKRQSTDPNAPGYFDPLAPKIPNNQNPASPDFQFNWQRAYRQAEPTPDIPLPSVPEGWTANEWYMDRAAGMERRNQEALKATSNPVVDLVRDADKALMDAGGRLAYMLDPKGQVADFIGQNEQFLGDIGEDILAPVGRVVPGAGELGRMIGQGGQQFAATTARNPVQGMTEATDMLEPTHYLAGGVNDLGEAGRQLMAGNPEAARAAYMEATPKILGGTVGMVPFGSSIVSAGARQIAAPRNALQAQARRALNAADEVAPPVGRLPPPTSQAGPQAPPAGAAQPQPSVSPVAQPTVTQGPRGGAQPGATGAGQQAAGAVPPAGPATLQASPTVVQSPQAASLARSDAKIIRRLLVAGGVARNDVDRLLGDMVEAFNRSNDSRSRLAFFAEEYLPQQLPKEVADDVIQKLRGFGRERFGANSPRDPSRSIMRSNIGELRGSQREYLTDEFEGLLGKETLMNKQGKITRDKQGVAEAVYAEEIGRQQRLLADSLATPEQVAARDDLLLLMGREDFFKQVPPELHLKAADEGKSLWEFVHQNPLEAAHWMQSELGVLARKGNTIAQSMRMPLVRRLEDAVPGYRGARLEYGDLSGQQAALEFGDDLYRVAASKFDTDNKELEFKKLSPAQRTVAKKSIRDKLMNEFRKAKTGDDQAAVITAMQKDGVLDALETILGPDGKKVADAIRGMVKENERLRAVDLLSGSNTADNLAQQAAAREAVRSPINKSIGALGDEASYLQSAFADAVSVALGLPPVWTASKLGTKAVSKFGTPSKKKLASATRTLYGSPPRNALNVDAPKPPPAKPRATPKPRVPKPPVTQEDLDALLAQYDRTPTPAIRNKIIAARKALGQAPTSNKLATPKPPPAKTGGKKPPPGTQSNSSAAVTGALLSGGTAYVASDGDPLATFAAAAGGGVLGNRLSKMGGSKPKTVKPPPGAGGKPPPVGAKAGKVSLANAEKVLSDVRVASQLSQKQYIPLFDAVNEQMQALQKRTVRMDAAGDKIPYINTDAGYQENMRLNALLMNYFRNADGSMNFDKVGRWAERNDPDRVLRIEAGRMANDLEDGGPPSIKATPEPAPYTDRPRRSPAPPSKGPGGKPPPKGPDRTKLSAFPGADEGAQKSLAVVHNLSEANLLHADELGGLAAPSLAVVDTNKGTLNKFGEISLIARPDILNSRGVRTFDSDIYSPRHPRAEYSLNDKAVRQLDQTLKSETAEFGDLRDIDWDSASKEGPAALARNDRVRAAFLKSRGLMPARLPHKKMPEDFGPAHAQAARLPNIGKDRWELRDDPQLKQIATNYYDNELVKLREVDPELAAKLESRFFEVGENGERQLTRNYADRFAQDAKRAKQVLDGEVDTIELSSMVSKKLRNKKVADDLDDYVADMAKTAFGDKRLFKGFTYSGNRKYSPYTMENVLREMTQSLQGGENWHYGAGSIRAKYAKELKSIDAIRASKSKLVAEGGMDAAKDKAQKDLLGLLEYLARYYKFGGDNRFMALDDMSKAIAEGPRGVREAFDFRGNAEPMQRIQSFIDDLRNMPTEYFEAKANRAVGLNEFATAVVPRGASPKVIEALKRAGVKIRYYNKSDPTSRAKAIQNERSTLFAFPGGTAAQVGAGVGGAAYGAANAQDLNGDGEIDGEELTLSMMAPGFLGLTAAGVTRNALSRGPRGPKPPPASSAFGGGKGPPKPPPAPRPKNALGGIAGRAATGGLIGGLAGSLTGDAQAQDYDAQLADVQALIDRLESDKAFFATATASQIQERLAKEGFDLGRYGADGKIGKDTAAAIRGYKDQIEADLKASKDRRAQIEQDRAYSRTKPNAFQQGFRETAPWVGAGAGLLLGLKGRAGAVAKSTRQAPAKIAKANALIGSGPVGGRSAAAKAAVDDRMGNINEFWRMGGAGEQVPLKTIKSGEWRPRAKATSPSKLYPENIKRRWGAVDTGVVASGLAESVVSGQYAASLEGEIREAEIVAKNNPTEANLARVQSLKDLHAAATAASRLGMFIAGGRVIGAMKMPYASTRPNVAEAEAELARLLAYIQKTKK